MDSGHLKSLLSYSRQLLSFHWSKYRTLKEFWIVPFLNSFDFVSILFKDTYREKAPANKTPVLTKSMNMDTWVVGTSNQLFIKGSYTETKSSKKWGSYW